MKEEHNAILRGRFIVTQTNLKKWEKLKQYNHTTTKIRKKTKLNSKLEEKRKTSEQRSMKT